MLIRIRAIYSSVKTGIANLIVKFNLRGFRFT